jgi:predicted acetyltransferase
VRGRPPTLLLAYFADTQDLSTGDGDHPPSRKPNNQLLPGYERALAAGWSPETSPEPQHGIREQHLCEIRTDPQGFLKRLTGTNRVVERLLDGTPVPRMREVVYWISDGEFSGVISLRCLRNSGELPAGVSGHVSYAVVPWKSRKGYASQALADCFKRRPAPGSSACSSQRTKIICPRVAS